MMYGNHNKKRQILMTHDNRERERFRRTTQVDKEEKENSHTFFLVIATPPSFRFS